jgi:hypothetical protein
MITFSANPRDPSGTFGPADLVCRGICTHDDARRRGLVLDLYLLGFPGTEPLFGRLVRSPRIPAVRFELRPDLRHAMLGRDVWGRLQATAKTLPRPFNLPDYAETQAHLARRQGTVLLQPGLRLALLRVAVGSPVVSWSDSHPAWWFELRVGLSNDLPGNVCVLGSDILRHGLLCWDNGVSYFFHRRETQGAQVASNGFHTPEATPI